MIKMVNKKGIGKVSIKSSGKGKYGALWIYVPSKLAKDSSFPFDDKEKINIEIEDGKLIMSKKDDWLDLLNDYGLENGTLSYLLESKAKKNKNRPFLYHEDEVYTYQELNEISNRIAHGILKINRRLERSKARISIMMPNCPDFLFSWFGAVKARSIVILLNKNMDIDMLKDVLEDSRTSILMIDYQYFDMFKDIIDDLPLIKRVIIRNAPDFNYDEKYLDFNEVYTKITKNPRYRKNPLREMEILYTSGATGKPRGVIYRHFMVLGGLLIANELAQMGFDKNQRIYCPLPLYNGIIQMVVVFPTIFADASLILTELHPTQFWNDVKRYNATGITSFGRMLSILMDQPHTENERNHNVKFALGAVTPRNIWERFESRFGITIYETWAIAEASGITINLAGSKGGKLGSVGKPVIGFEVKIVDSFGNELPPGPDNIGEIIARNRVPINLEYQNIDEYIDTAKWFRTNDLGYMDNDGYLYYLGRVNDIIMRGNRLISTQEIENFANNHPFILESSAFGVPNGQNENQEIKICVVLKDEMSHKLTHEELAQYFNRNLAYYMVPRYIEFKETLAKTATEQIMKFILKKEWDDVEIKKATWDQKLQKFCA